MALRAVHQEVDGTPKILDDPIAPRLLGARWTARAVAAAREHPNPRMTALRSHIVTRSRYAEDRMAEAVGRGAAQLVALGAGYDTFAYRQPPWARAARVFEVDQPASQAAKRRRLAEAGIAVPANVTYVAVDFETTPLADGLAAGGVARDQVTFFSWLGVLVYLEEAAVDAVLRTVAVYPRGSEIVLTFSPPDSDGAASRMAAHVAAMGEPWKTRLEPEVLLAKLRAAGFSESGLVSAQDLTARYFTDRTDGLPPPSRERLAWARV
jgi:methyltransferase (TIGR00027 family)